MTARTNTAEKIDVSAVVTMPEATEATASLPTADAPTKDTGFIVRTYSGRKITRESGGPFVDDIKFEVHFDHEESLRSHGANNAIIAKVGELRNDWKKNGNRPGQLIRIYMSKMIPREKADPVDKTVAAMAKLPRDGRIAALVAMGIDRAAATVAVDAQIAQGL